MLNLFVKTSIILLIIDYMGILIVFFIAFRKRSSVQHRLLVLIEKFKEVIDKVQEFGAYYVLQMHLIVMIRNF